MLKDDCSCAYPSKWGRSLSRIVAIMDQHDYQTMSQAASEVDTYRRTPSTGSSR